MASGGISPRPSSVWKTGNGRGTLRSCSEGGREEERRTHPAQGASVLLVLRQQAQHRPPFGPLDSCSLRTGRDVLFAAVVTLATHAKIHLIKGDTE